MAGDYEYVVPVARPAAVLRHKKRIKHMAYSVQLVFSSVVITTLAVIMMRARNPKFQITAAGVRTVKYAPDRNSPSFNMRLNIEVAVKNPNFGHFTYENSSLKFAYGNITVGEASIAKDVVGARATRKVKMTVGLSSDNVLGNPNLGNDVISGMLRLSSYGVLRGEVHLVKVTKKKRSAELNCTMAVNMSEGRVRDLKCS